MNNLKFNYLYRDGANYKSWGEVIFTNPEQLSLDVIKERLIGAFLSEEFFVASQVSIPEKFLFLDGKLTKYDHCYHEFDCIEICQEEPNDILNRSIAEFLKDAELVSESGWEEFDILDHA